MKRFLLGLWQRLRGTPGSALRPAAAVGLGLFIGCQPLYGLHLVLVLALCLPLKLDAVLAYLAANISNPLVAPFLIFSEVELGAYLISGHFIGFDLEQARANGAAGFARQLIVGSLVLGAVLGLVGALVAWLVASLYRRAPGRSLPDRSALELAAERTRLRYESAPRGDRYYVAAKLALDPVFELIAALPGDFGRVLDLGCGRGQLGLLLLELGRASHVSGVDSDARKIEVARAAGPEADFRAADLAHGSLGLADGEAAADTILLVDVLHYLPLAEQDQLLEAALGALSQGGRLVIRDLDGEPSARSWVTRLFEWIARRTGLNRGRATSYRPAREVTALLERAGLPCSVQGASERTPFANVLIVAGGSPALIRDSSGSAPSTFVSAAKA